MGSFTHPFVVKQKRKRKRRKQQIYRDHKKNSKFLKKTETNEEMRERERRGPVISTWDPQCLQ